MFGAAAKAEWTSYVEYKGLPIGTLIRQYMAESMQRDGWVYEPAQEDKAQE